MCVVPIQKWEKKNRKRNENIKNKRALLAKQNQQRTAAAAAAAAASSGGGSRNTYWQQRASSSSGKQAVAAAAAAVAVVAATESHVEYTKYWSMRSNECPTLIEAHRPQDGHRYAQALGSRVALLSQADPRQAIYSLLAWLVYSRGRCAGVIRSGLVRFTPKKCQYISYNTQCSAKKVSPKITQSSDSSSINRKAAAPPPAPPPPPPPPACA